MSYPLIRDELIVNLGPLLESPVSNFKEAIRKRLLSAVF